MAAVRLQARFAIAKPGLVYRMEVSDGQVVMQTEQAKGSSPRRRYLRATRLAT